MNVVGNRFWFHRIWDWGTKALPSTLSTTETVFSKNRVRRECANLWIRDCVAAIVEINHRCTGLNNEGHSHGFSDYLTGESENSDGLRYQPKRKRSVQWKYS
jgi:hypothetical protein